MITLNIETTKEFEIRHSAPGFPKLEDKKNMRFLFSDGAWYPDQLSAEPMVAQYQRHEPAEGDQLLIDRRRYFRLALDIAEREFNSTKMQFDAMAALAVRYSNLPGPPMDAKKVLLDMRLTVFAVRKELEKIEQAIAETPAAKRRQAILDQQAERARQVAALKSDFMEVSI